MSGEKNIATPEALSALVRASRSVRRFDEATRVKREELLALIDDARFAPTGNNTQLVRFHVVSDPAECDLVFSHLHWAAALKDWDGPATGERPTGYVIVCLPTSGVDANVRNMDVGICAQTLALAAAARGLGCCMHLSFDRTLGSKLALRADGLEPALVLAFGVPAEKVELEVVGEDGSTTYWRDADDVHHVPKRTLDDCLA